MGVTYCGEGRKFKCGYKATIPSGTPLSIQCMFCRCATQAEGAPLRFMVASGGVSEGCGHGAPGVSLGDGQTEAEGVPSQATRCSGVCPHT